MMTRLIYRPDIDGLRAIAVLAVVVYHAFPNALPGGFLGVDVFFVISGFVITGSIYPQVKEGSFSLAAFYERRARRLAPAAGLMLLASLAAGWVMLLPAAFDSLAKSAFAAALFFSNWHFMATASYFADSAALTPLLHTWSLSVEEQFYLVAPAAVLLSRGRWRYLMIILGLATAASWLYSRHLQLNAPEAEYFFNSLGRSWELGLGCVGAMIYLRWQPGALLSAIMRLIGLTMISYSLVQFSGGSSMTAGKMLLPCLGTLLLLMAWPIEPVARILSLGPITYIGRISYGLYIWHWPALVYASIWFGDLSPGLTIAVFGLVATISVASYHLVEMPIRERRALKRGWSAFVPAITAAIGALVLVQASAKTGGIPARLPEEARHAMQAANDFDERIRKCFIPGDDYRNALVDMAKANELCRLGDENAPVDFVVWGDSHAYAVASAFDDVGRALGRSGLMAAYASCAPVAGTFTASAEGSRCPEFYDAVLQTVRERGIQTAFLVGRWPMYIDGESSSSIGTGNGPLRLVGSNETDATAALKAGLRETLRDLAGIHVSVLLSVPTHPVDVPATVATQMIRGAPSDSLWVSTADYMRTRQSSETIFRSMKIDTLDPMPALCPGTKCLAEMNGYPLYMDDDHLNRAGARMLSQLIGEALRK